MIRIKHGAGRSPTAVRRVHPSIRTAVRRVHPGIRTAVRRVHPGIRTAVQLPVGCGVRNGIGRRSVSGLAGAVSDRRSLQMGAA